MNSNNPFNIAIVGCDTSHSVQFTRLLNDETQPDHIAGARIIAAVADPYGCIAGSGEKALKNAALLQSQYGVQLCEAIAELPENLDSIFILGTDGTRHLPQFIECVERGVPIFIDKPFTTSSEEAESIFRIAAERNVPVVSASSLRFEDNFLAAQAACNGEKVTGADCYGYIELEPTAPGFFWYGIHIAELLIAAMGTGLQHVTVTSQENYDVITGIWADGRVGTIRGSRQPHYQYGGTLHTAVEPIPFVVPNDTSYTYARLVDRLLGFIETGVSPFDPRETLEIIRFLELAEELRQSARFSSLKSLAGI